MSKFIKKIKAFTLIELLVVIAIIAILAAILIPAVTSGLDKARILKMVSNGKSIYTSVFAADAEDLVSITFPKTSDFATSTLYFEYVVTSGVMNVDFSFFSGPGTEVQKSTAIADFDLDGNAWNVGEGAAAGIDGYPFLISRNYTTTPLTSSTTTKVGAGLVAPGSAVLKFSQSQVVVTQKGGASFAVETNAVLTAINPTGASVPLLLP